MLPQLAAIKGTILDFLFPRRCIGCGREGDFICSSCLHTAKRILPPICPFCGRPQPSGMLCPSCINKQFNIDGIRSPFRFEGIVREAIHQLKYRNLRDVSNILARLLAEYLHKYPIPVEVIVPIPLHPKRLRERGYNQTLLLARDLNKYAKLAVVADCLIRYKYSTPQAKTSSVQDRYKNVLDIFKCVNDNLKGKKVLLIDDVVTSGATINACAKSIKASGADSVWGLVVAREI